MFPWGTCQVVVTISIVFGFYTIHTGSVGAAKGPRIEHFCRFRLFLGYFSSLWRSPCILCIQMFSRGTYQIMACIWTVLGNLEIHAGFVGYSIRAQNWAFLPLKGLFKVPIKLSNPSECFLEVPTRYWLIIQLFRALKGPKIRSILILRKKEEKWYSIYHQNFNSGYIIHFFREIYILKGDRCFCCYF